MRKEKIRIKLTKKDYIMLLLFLFFALLTSVLWGLCFWAGSTFNVGINAIINTLLSSLQGTSRTTILPAVWSCIPWMVIASIVSVILGWLVNSARRKNREIKTIAFLFWGGIFACIVLCVVYLQYRYEFIQYLTSKSDETSLYADQYVDPRSVHIQNNGQKRNLIYIYMESMENTYADEENGGIQKENYIPHLTEMADEYFSFSPIEELGGFQTVNGADWTMGAMFTTTAGVPFEFPVGSNDMEQQELFASGIFNLGDFLAKQGYYQKFLCGSDGDFAGRKKYMEQHGNYEVYDYNKAVENGDIPEDYFVFWGYEDAKLYEIAKEQLMDMAQREQPFNLTMLTVDTHHIGGYVCQLCDNEYDVDLANVVKCADRQVFDFIKWVQQQDFYDNTTIVITGDHIRMDNVLMGWQPVDKRLIYNCYINTVFDGQEINERRTSSAMDVFPTTLAAMGYEIEGNVLGLGTNLFSDVPTLVEEMGIQSLNDELMKSSKYYVDSFSPELSYLVEDEFNSLQTIYFYGSGSNAEQFMKSPYRQEGGGSWILGETAEMDIPLKHEDGEVNVNITIGLTYKTDQRILIYQEGECIDERSISASDTYDVVAKIKDGHCKLFMEFPDAITPSDMGEIIGDDSKLSVWFKKIIIDEKDK